MELLALVLLALLLALTAAAQQDTEKGVHVAGRVCESATWKASGGLAWRTGAGCLGELASPGSRTTSAVRQAVVHHGVSRCCQRGALH